MHVDQIRWVLELGIMIAAARAAGELLRRMQLSAVIGEIIIGVLLGAGVLGVIHGGEVIHAFAEVGVLLLIFSLGLETKIDQLRAVGLTAAGVAAGGVVLPFAAGYGLGRVFGLDATASLFMGAVLTATSIAVSTRLLMDLGLGGSAAAKVILAAAIIDDVVGLLVLTAVIAAVSGHEGGLASQLLPIGLFLVIGLPILYWLLPRLLRGARQLGGEQAGLAVTVGVTLAVGWIASQCGLEALIGAFFAGLFFGTTPAAHDLEHEIEPVVRLFAPVFFVSIGLSIIPAEMMSALGLGLALTAVGIITKLVGCGLPARLGGLGWRESALVGSGMVPRGEVGLIIAGIGVQGGFLDPIAFSAAAFACITTILFAPPAIRYLARDIQQTAPVMATATQEAA
jgi:Kef-type K+ transport system membrane component KefB